MNGAHRLVHTLLDVGLDTCLTNPGTSEMHFVAALLPEPAIVIDEGVSAGRGLDRATGGAAPHDWLTGRGGSIGFGLPAVLGVAVQAMRAATVGTFVPAWRRAMAQRGLVLIEAVP